MGGNTGKEHRGRNAPVDSTKLSDLMIRELECFFYEDRLRELGLFRLENERFRETLL